VIFPVERGSDFLRIANIAGVQLVLNPWFIAVIFLFIVADMSSKVFLVFSAVLWHELAHARVAMVLGYKVKEIELLPFGGVARIEGLGSVSSSHEMMIAAAGPAASLVLAAASYIGVNYGTLGIDVWDFCYKTNMMLAIFNLLPGLPLDGGRILRAWLALYIEYQKATVIAAGISKCLSIGLLITIGYQYIANSTVNLTFLMAAVFLYITARSEIAVAGFRTLRILAQKKADLIARGVMPTTYFTVLQSVMLKDVVRLFKPNQYYLVLIVDAECKLCGSVTETEIWEQLAYKGLYAKMGEFI